MANGICELKRKVKQLNKIAETQYLIKKFLFIDQNGKNCDNTTITKNVSELFYRLSAKDWVRMNSYYRRLGIGKHTTIFNFLGLPEQLNKKYVVDVGIVDDQYYCVIRNINQNDIDLGHVNSIIQYSTFSNIFKIEILSNPFETYEIKIKLGDISGLTDNFIKPYYISCGQIENQENKIKKEKMINDFKKMAKSFFNDTLTLYDDKIKKASLKNKENAKLIEELSNQINKLKIDIAFNEDKIKMLNKNRSEKMLELVNKLIE